MDRAALVGLSSSVLRIETLRSEGGTSLGSGVLIDTDKVVTNCHVTRDAVEVFVVRGDAQWRAEAQASDVRHDLCVLRVVGIRADVVSIGRTAGLRLGQSVTALGFTGGTGIQNSAGDVVALHRFDGSSVVQSTNWFSSGASGGGLFDDSRHLVGILTFRLRGGATHYFAAPVEWLRPLLSDPAGFHPIKPLATKQLAYWQEPIDAQPNFLRAAVLERDRRWADLESLASGWTDTDSGDWEPWYLMGLAHLELEEAGPARRALERAVAIEPAFGDAWFRLGLLYARLGLTDKAHQAEQTLRELNPERAIELLQAIGKT